LAAHNQLPRNLTLQGEPEVQVYWERIAVLGPIYRLVGRGFNDQDITKELNIPKSIVHDCISWMLKSFDMPDRLDLVRHASAIGIRQDPTRPAEIAPKGQ
jgi:hypothetical protein